MSLSALFLVCLGVFFIVYSAVQAAASYDRQRYVLQSERLIFLILQTERTLIIFDLMFLIVAVIYLIATIIQNEGGNPRRLGLIGSSLICVLIGILFSDIFCVLSGYLIDTIIPNLLIATIHMTFASIIIFLLHTGGGQPYDTIVDQEKNQMTVDFERRSDDDDEEDETDDDEGESIQ
jgi:hypothetical protein